MNYMGIASSEVGQARVVPRKRNVYEVVDPAEARASWSHLEGGPNSPLWAVVLNVWDNISGPRVEHAWKGDSVDDTIVQQSATFSLSGELLDWHDLTVAAERLEYKMMLLPDHVAACMIFCAPFRDVLSRFTLVLLFAPHVQRLINCLQPILQDRLLQLVDLYRAAVHAEIESPTRALDVLIPFISSNLSAIVISPPAPVPIARTMFAQPTLKADDHALLATAITALLQCGSCVVLGADEARVLLWLRTLAHWGFPASRRLVSLRLRHGAHTYVPDLALQGIVITEPLEDEALIQSIAPTAIVDTQLGIVRVTPPYHEYAVIRRDYLSQRRKRHLRMLAPISPRSSTGTQLESGSGKLDVQAPVNLWEATEHLLRAVQPSTLVSNALSRIMSNPPSPTYLRAWAVPNAVELLELKAAAVIAFVGSLLDELEQKRTTIRKENSDEFSVGIAPESPRSGPAPSPHGSRQSSMRYSHRPVRSDGSEDLPHPDEFGALDPRESKRRIRESLGLAEPCFSMLLGLAEKIQPGTFAAVAGNPAWIEEKLIELFEQF